jgi:flagellar biosynthesis anti-sigma factor FlgM
MKISEQGFTERLGTSTGRVGSTGDAAQGTSASSKQQGGTSDQLQLSSFASRLQSAGSSGDAGSSSQASRLSQIAQLVNSGGYQIDPSKISSAMVSEAVQSSAR